MVETVKENLSNVSEIIDKVDIFFNNEIQPEDDEALSVLKQDQYLIF